MNTSDWIAIAGLLMSGINLGFLLTLIFNHMYHLAGAIKEVREILLRHLAAHAENKDA